MSNNKNLFAPTSIEEVKKEKGRWEQETYKKQDTGDEAKTHSGIPIKLLYTPEDVADLNYMRDLGFSGEEPYVRGVYPNMYRGRQFTVRQLAGFGGPEECNQRIKFLLGQGATGVNIIFDLPTIRGYDSDDPEAEGNIGYCGVTIDSLQDVEALWDGIPIDKVSSSVVTHLPSTTIAILSMYIAMAERRGVSLNDISGTNQNDFLMETTIGSGYEILPPSKSFRIQCDVVEYAAKHLPRWNPISYNGYNLREAGTDAVQEVAIAISNAIATSEELIKRGVPIDSFARRLSFFWDLFNDFFEEIAKCRASRRVFYKVMKERLGAKDPRSYLMRFHVQTAGITLTYAEPLNNISRSAFQAMAAVLGGCQSLHVDSYDEAYSVPTEQAALISLRTQQILQNETGVTQTVDPLAGSYYVEYLTDEMEKRMFDYIAEIEKRGGIVACAESGWLHREISDYAYRYQKAVETGDEKVVGVNFFKSDVELEKIEIFEYPNIEDRQRAKLQKLRAERDSAKVKQCLDTLREKCHGTENLMPYVLESVKAYATLGEIEEIFRQEYGLWQFPLIR